MCAYVYLFTFFNFLIGEHCKRKLGINCFQKTVQTVEYYTLNDVFSESWWLKKEMRNLLDDVLIWFFCHQNAKIEYKKNNIVHKMSEISK
jgi:hypothetical protein